MQRLRGCERPPPCLPSGSWGARPRKWDPGWGCGYISHRHYPHESHIYRYIDVYIDVEWCRYIHSALHVCVHIYICHICLYVYIRCIYIYTSKCIRTNDMKWLLKIGDHQTMLRSTPFPPTCLMYWFIVYLEFKHLLGILPPTMEFWHGFQAKKTRGSTKTPASRKYHRFFLMGQQSVESVVILRWKWFRPNKGNCLPMMKTSSCGTVADPTSHWHILTCSDLLNSIGDGSAVTQPSCHTAGPVLRQVLQAQRAPDRIGTLLDQRRWTIAQLGSSFDQRK